MAENGRLAAVFIGLPERCHHEAVRPFRLASTEGGGGTRVNAQVPPPLLPMPPQLDLGQRGKGATTTTAAAVILDA
ncbi:hypothetical protein TYRP_008385 [Tyrophagus putrescentiae]|nr:hypothetical protein TYRP_008385 [Tyrophagus putrescentiae]